jgi:hypothetical protein
MKLANKFASDGNDEPATEFATIIERDLNRHKPTVAIVDLVALEHAGQPCRIV